MRLPPEARRREDVARERLLREMTPNKLYALEREKERLLSLKLDGGRREGHDVRKLVVAARAVMPGRRVPGLDTDRDRHEGGRGVGKMVKAALHQVKMVPGVVNRGTRAVGVDRKTVQPVIRGGSPPKKTNRPRTRPKILRKVVLPSTVRVENLTNILGVKLCESPSSWNIPLPCS